MSVTIRLIVVAILYLCSLPLPALPGRAAQPAKTFPSGLTIGATHGESGAPGWVCLVYVPFVCFVPAWWANPCLFIGCFCLAKGARKAARIWGFVALGLAGTYPIQVLLLDYPIKSILELPGKVLSFGSLLGPGYYVWLASIATLLIGGARPGSRGFKPGKVQAFDEI
jgi:hypothetical protein